MSWSEAGWGGVPKPKCEEGAQSRPRMIPCTALLQPEVDIGGDSPDENRGAGDVGLHCNGWRHRAPGAQKGTSSGSLRTGISSQTVFSPFSSRRASSLSTNESI